MMTPHFALLHPRDQIVATMQRIYGRDMTTTSGGNVSVRDDSGDVWMTPARVDKGSLQRQDIVRIRPDGGSDGIHPPSSECPFHLSIYGARPDIRAIVHAHPGALVSFSICGQAPNTRLFPEARNVCGEVAMAPYALPGSRQLGVNIAAEFASGARPDCVVLENHGVVVGAGDLTRAFARFETLEFTARTEIRARQLGRVRYLDDARLAWKPENRLPECDPLPPSSREKELRKEICDFVHRAYRHRLMTSTWGSFSARIDERSFVVTPTGADRDALTVADLVVVRDGKCPAGAFPSRAVPIHLAIYRAHPEIQAVVNALPVSATAFSASEVPLDTRTIPESYIFLKDVAKIPFSPRGGYDNESIAERIGPERPVALLENNGALVAGQTVLDAFDRLEVLEATAAAIIDGLALGPLTPMSDEVIRELRDAFPNV